MLPSKLQSSRSVSETDLGPSDQKRLTSVDRDKPDLEKEFILRLPFEILAHIVNIVSSDPDCSRHSYSTWKTLSVVCRRFAFIVLPVLYRHIEIQIPLLNPPLRRLHLTPQRVSALRDHCKELHIRINATTPPTNEDLFLVQDLISYLSNVQVLSIQGGYDKSFLQCASQYMRRVHSLDLRRKMGGFFLRDIVEQIDIPWLQNLTLCGVYRQSTSTEASVLLEPKKFRTATFTSLVLGDYEETPEATQQLINWPESLVHFRFDCSYNNIFYMDLPMFGEWLAIHKDTLKSINIGYLPFGGNERLLYACGLPKLEVLTLSRWQLGGWPRSLHEKLIFSTLHADTLLGPNLHTFILDFSMYGQHFEAWTDFGEQEEHWVTGFAKAAIDRKAALRKIQIIFKPNTKESTEEQGYPWDRMDRIRDEIQIHGLALEYNKPCLTKEEWLQPLRENSYVYRIPSNG